MTKNKENIGYVAFLSVVAALGGFLFGYDTAVISGTISKVTAQFSLTEIQTGWYVGCALVGSILGVSMAGVISDHLGRKLTLILAAILFSVSAIGCALSGNFTILVLYRIIGGIGIGVVSIISPLYISEVSIPRYRGALVSLYQLAITVGFLGAYLVNYQLLDIAVTHVTLGGELGTKILITEVWRGMLGAEALPALMFFTIIFLIPESPRWLVMRNREHKAKSTLMRIFQNELVVDGQIADIKSLTSKGEQSDWSIALKPGFFKAIMIGVAIAVLGQFMGVNAVLYYGPTIFESSGLSSGDSLFYQVLVGLVNTITTVIALLIIDKVGRKKLVYWGVSGMIVALLAIGIYFMMDSQWPSVLLLVFFLFYIFCCAISICAVIWVLLSEMYPTRIRGLAMSIAGFSLWIGTFLIGQLTPWMLTNLSPAGTFFLFAVMCLPYMWIIWKKVPETAGQSLEEIERMWMKEQ
jgi:sugar porter (SP) family MFS transporter